VAAETAAVFIYLPFRAKIDQDWADWFENLDVIPTGEGNTILKGEVADQSAVYGILAKLRDLGLELLFVEQSD
jgi:hypothetical protein